jgi:hypothetical protein
VNKMAGNFTDIEGSTAIPRSTLRAVLGTSLERKTGQEARIASLNLGGERPHDPNVSPGSDLVAMGEWSRTMVTEAGGALFCTTATGHVWVMDTVRSALLIALKLVERARLNDALVVRVALDLGDVEQGTVSGSGRVFERVLGQLEAWDGSGIACSLAASESVGIGLKLAFEPGPLPGTVSPFLR